MSPVSSPLRPSRCQGLGSTSGSTLIPTSYERWIRSKLAVSTARTLSSMVPLAAQSRELPVPYSVPAGLTLAMLPAGEMWHELRKYPTTRPHHLSIDADFHHHQQAADQQTDRDECHQCSPHQTAEAAEARQLENPIHGGIDEKTAPHADGDARPGDRCLGRESVAQADAEHRHDKPKKA